MRKIWRIAQIRFHILVKSTKQIASSEIYMK